MDEKQSKCAEDGSKVGATRGAKLYGLPKEETPGSSNQRKEKHESWMPRE
jgi:hypothetical protein